MKNVVIILKDWFRSSKQPIAVVAPEKRSGSQVQSQAQGIDYVLLFLVVALVLFGLIMVYSSSFIYAQEKTGNGFAFIGKQLVFACLGFCVLFVTCRIDYRKWGQWAYPVLGLAIALLALVFVPGIGQKVGGARRWIQVAGLRFQPGEFAKFAIIFFVARQLDRKSERLETITGGVLSHFIIPLPALLLLLLQPDFGTTVIISMVIFSLLFMGGVPMRFLFTAVASASALGGWLAFGTA